MTTATGMAIFAPAGSQLETWALSAVEAGGALVTEDEAIARIPQGTTWLCSGDQEARLRWLRPADPVLVVRDPATKDSAPAWAQLAHDVRGPISVLNGALSELDSSDPMHELAVRATRQLAHLAQCWEACGLAPKRAPTKVLAVLEHSHTTFGLLEPRRVDSIRIGGSDRTLETDAKRLELGLLCMWSHLSRVQRGPIVVRARIDGIEMDGGAPLHGTRDDTPCSSSRLHLALRLLTPITDRWVVEEAYTRWVARAE